MLFSRQNSRISSVSCVPKQLVYHPINALQERLIIFVVATGYEPG
jgi:hypothetical protein